MAKIYDEKPQIDLQVKTRSELEAAGEQSYRFQCFDPDGRLHWIDDDGVYHQGAAKGNVSTSNPGTTDDSSKGYVVGSPWFNYATGVAWWCKNTSAGAAVWVTFGESNTAINSGGAAELALPKEGSALPFRTIEGAGGTTIDQQAEKIVISSTGESNTNTNAGGGAEIMKAKVGADTPARTLTAGAGAAVNEGTNEIEVSAPLAVAGAATTLETGGWEDIYSYSMDFDVPTRIFTIDVPTFPFPRAYYRYWLAGIEYNKVAPETIEIPDVEGLYLIYYVGSVLTLMHKPTSSTSFEVLRKDQTVAYLYWNAVDKKVEYFGREPHTRAMPPTVHADLHASIGAYWVEGLVPTDLVTGGATGADTSAQFGFTSGIISDEDVPSFMRQFLSTEGLKVYYQLGPEADPLLRSGGEPGFSVIRFGQANERLAFNELTGGSWQLSEVSNKDYVLCHVFGNNSHDEDQKTFAMLGQAEYGNISAAREGAQTEIDKLVLGGLVGPEMKSLATFLLRTDTAYANTVKAIFKPFDDGDYIDWRKASSRGGGGGGVTTHFLNDILDVNVPTPTGGYYLGWNPTTMRWEALPPNAEYLWNKQIDEIFEGDTDGVQVADTEANLLPDPNNIPDWSNARCVNGATDEIIADTADNTHFRSKDATYAAGKHVIGADFKAGNKPWASFLVTDSSNSSIVFNMSTLEVGSTSGTFEYRFVDPIDSNFDCRVELCIDKTAGFYGVAFFAYESDTDATFAGDGATVNTYVKNIHAYKGEFGDNVKFVDGGASAVPPTTTVSKLIYKQAKWDAGLVQKAGDPNDIVNWVPASSVTTVTGAMDASPGNVLALRRAGLHQVVSTGAWGPLVAGTQYWANDDSGNFVELFEGSTSLNDIELVPSATPEIGFYATSLHSKGRVYSAFGSVMVPSYVDADNKAAIQTTDSGMRLVFDILYSDLGDRSYKVEVEYIWATAGVPS